MTERLLVNPIECEGHGACAELLPELITLDEWGYPIVDGRPIPPALDRDARAAVSACPTLALRLTRVSLSRSLPPQSRRHGRPCGSLGRRAYGARHPALPKGQASQGG